MKKLTRQETFNIVYKHLLTQNKRCEVENVGCLYRGERDMKCAVGVLIPDSMYETDMDSGCLGASELLSKYPYLKDLFNKNSFRDNLGTFLDTLQSIHDASPVGMWKYELEEFAKETNLKVPEIN